METKWDPDPERSRAIENKRTEMKILYGNKVDRWLAKYPTQCPQREYFINARLVLIGRIKKLTMKMLDPLERMLHCNFGAIPQVDLCSDDEDVKVVEEKHVHARPNNQTKVAATSMLPEIIIESDSEDDIRVVQDLPSPDVPVPQIKEPVPSPASLQIPLPALSVLPFASLDLSVPETTAPATSSATKQRRKSVNSRPKSSKDLPSIADYKIKTPSLQPPSIYAKTGQDAPRERQIISVPYKHPVRKAPADDDPLKNVQKLANFKEKLYAKIYLSFDVADKLEMQKKLEEETLAKEKEKKDEQSSDISDDDVPLLKRRRKSVCNPGRKSKSNETGSSKKTQHNAEKEKPKPVAPKPRRKSMAEPKVMKPSPSRTIKATKPSEKKNVKTKAVPVTKRANKPAKKKVSALDSDDDDDYTPPTHVLDPIEADLEALQNGTYAERHWERPQPAASCSENSIETASPKSLENGPNNPKETETATDPTLEQSFDEDNLLVEVEIDPKKFRKPRRTTRMVPKRRATQYNGPPRPRGRPRRGAAKEVKVKEEPLD